MPRIVAPNQGLPTLLDLVLKTPLVTPFDMQLGLFANDLTPSQSTVRSDLVVPSWVGYGNVTLQRANWLPSVVSADHGVSFYTNLAQSWTNNSGVNWTIYGVFFLDPTNTLLLFAQRFEPGDIRSLAPGSVITYLPRITLTTEP